MEDALTAPAQGLTKFNRPVTRLSGILIPNPGVVSNLFLSLSSPEDRFPSVFGAA